MRKKEENKETEEKLQENKTETLKLSWFIFFRVNQKRDTMRPQIYMSYFPSFKTDSYAK